MRKFRLVPASVFKICQLKKLVKLNNYVQWVFCGAAENERGSEGAEGAARHRA